ncbi:hypothetical protein Q7P37_005216 [Cladosporium fusiforme]
MVGKNVLAAAAVYFALASALALPKDSGNDKTSKHHESDDDKPRLPHKPGRGPGGRGGDDKDCTTTDVPYPTGADPTAPGFPTAGSGTISVIFPTGTGVLRRNAYADKGKDDPITSTGTASTITATVTGVSSFEDNPNRGAAATGSDDNSGRGGADDNLTTGADGVATSTLTVTSTITSGPTVTITVTSSTATSTSTSKSSSKGRNGRKTKTSTRSSTTSSSATSTSSVDDSAPTA